MTIPQNITRDDVLEALEEVDQKGENPRERSTKYKLVHEGREYSPKHVIRIANKYANGRKLTPLDEEDEFFGGPDLRTHTHTDRCTEYKANCFLDQLGFEIRKIST